jgi:hypothetical protein
MPFVVLLVWHANRIVLSGVGMMKVRMKYLGRACVLGECLSDCMSSDFRLASCEGLPVRVGAGADASAFV